MCSFSHIHIFNNQTSQDAPTTTAVICDVVKDLEAAIPNLKEISIFSDNAGCYKSTLTLSTLPHEIGSKLSTYNFSEAQNGKGPCDRKAAHAKFAIKRYINEGRDVTTAYDMKKALDKVPGQPYRVKVVDTIHDLDVTKNKDTITNITSFYNFRFENSHLRMWQAYNIGEGKLVT
ncbi:uncharacterized protein [Mytilus edulis]|uniref:uncharacterized protein n=1 Tax=Mytilus edulis TaxID=6550 RepID=UPI0039F102C6